MNESLDNLIQSICGRCNDGHTHQQKHIIETIYEVEDLNIFDFINYHVPILHKKYYALRYLYNNKKEVFIRHGLEKPHLADYKKDVIFPPKNSYHDINVEMNKIDYFAIELDQPPFNHCSNHGHMYGSPWYYVAGYMTVKDFNGKFKLSDDRDHFYAHSNHLAQDWIYMYNDLDEKVDLNSDIKRSDLYDSIEQLKSSELHSVHKDTAQKFLHLTNLIENIRSVNRYG